MYENSSRKSPTMGDLCWSNYWREFYVELSPLPDGQRASWWLGSVGETGFGNADRHDKVTVHRTPFEVGRDKIAVPYELIHSAYGALLGASYEEAKRIYRHLAFDWVQHGGLNVPSPTRRPRERPRTGYSATLSKPGPY